MNVDKGNIYLPVIPFLGLPPVLVAILQARVLRHCAAVGGVLVRVAVKWTGVVGHLSHRRMWVRVDIRSVGWTKGGGALVAAATDWTQ